MAKMEMKKGIKPAEAQIKKMGKLKPIVKLAKGGMVKGKKYKDSDAC